MQTKTVETKVKVPAEDEAHQDAQAQLTVYAAGEVHALLAGAPV